MAVWAGIAAVTGWYLTGLAVTVALVVYPAFAGVHPERWAAHHRLHSDRITLAVAPAWAVEGVASFGWLVSAAGGGGAGGAELAAAVLHGVAAAATVALTVGVAVPAHTALAGGWSPGPAARLRRSHLARTAAWALAAVVATAGTALAPHGVVLSGDPVVGCCGGSAAPPRGTPPVCSPARRPDGRSPARRCPRPGS